MSGGTKNGPMLCPPSIGVLDNPYQNQAAAAILAMHHSSPSNSAHIPPYNYLSPQGQLSLSSVPHSEGHASTFSLQERPSMNSQLYNPSMNPAHSLSRMPTPQDYVNAAAKRLNDQISANRKLSDDTLGGK